MRRARWGTAFGIVGLGALAAALTNCQGSAGKAEAPAAPLVFAWIPKEGANPVFDRGRRGAEAAATALSTSARRVEVLYLAPEGSDAAEKIRSQVALVRHAIDLRVNGIGISCNDGIALESVLDEAVRAGIPVMTWDADAPGSRRFTYYGMDNREAGATAARLLAGLVGEQGEVAVLSGTRGAQNLDARVDGFLEELARNHKAVRVVGKEYCDDTPSTCATRVEAVLAAKPELKGWFFAGLWALTTVSPSDAGATAMPRWEAGARSGQIKTVVFDTLPFELKLLTEGRVQALLGQKYFGWGYESVRMLFEHVTQRKQFPTFTDSSFDVVCPNAANDVARMWSSDDFTGPIAACELLK